MSKRMKPSESLETFYNTLDNEYEKMIKELSKQKENLKLKFQYFGLRICEINLIEYLEENSLEQVSSALINQIKPEISFQFHMLKAEEKLIEYKKKI